MPTTGPQPFQPAFNPLLGLQRTLGNQAVVRLFESGAIQAKLRVSQPGDADELEADRVAEQITSSRRGPALQRKCSCAGGSPCSKCEEEEGAIHRSAATPFLRSFPTSIQRFPADQSPPPEPGGAAPAALAGWAAARAPLIVDDDAQALAPGQMKKSQFMAELRSRVCATADAALVAVGRSTQSCPYIEQWLAFYAAQDSRHIERAIHKYAPETQRATRAQEYFSIISDRVRQAATTWAKTGRITGVPPGVPLMPTPSGPPGAAASGIPAVQGGQAKGAGGSAVTFPRGQAVLAKHQNGGSGKAADAEAVRERLGTGRPLDSNVRSGMEHAFGHSFSHVRLHTDSNAAKLSTELEARAFTIGEDVAFAAGEYKPGTLVGDALIAHELAHVVQQKGPGSGISSKSEASDTSLEEDADDSAATAMLGVWNGIKTSAVTVMRHALPRLKSGLSLQRCKSSEKAPGPAEGPIPDYDSFFDEHGQITEAQAAPLWSMIENWQQLERVYQDAKAGNERAKKVVDMIEWAMRDQGADVAQKTSSVSCQVPVVRELKTELVESCFPNWSKLDFLRRDKPGGRRLRQVVADAYAERAKALKIRNDIIQGGINLLLAGLAVKGGLAKSGAAGGEGALAGEAPVMGGEPSDVTAVGIDVEPGAAKDVAPGKTGAEPGKVGAVPAVAASPLQKALADLRVSHPEISGLSDAAFERIMAKGRAGSNLEAQVQQMKGQLLEELLGAEIRSQLTTEAGRAKLGLGGVRGNPEFIPGHSIRLIKREVAEDGTTKEMKQEISDGMVVVKDPLTKTMEAQVIAEAKAGAPSSEGMRKTQGRWTEESAADALGAIETDLEQSADMRQQFYKIHRRKLQTYKGAQFDTADKLADMHVSDLRALLPTVDAVKSTANRLGITQTELQASQFRRDIERTYDKGGSKVELTDEVTGKTEVWTLKVSPTRTRMVGTLPSDVAATKGARIATDVPAQGLQFEPLPAKLTEPELKKVAQELRKLIDQGM
jgi:hypothetical protein